MIPLWRYPMAAAMALILAGGAFLPASGAPVFRVLAGVEGGTNLLREGGFETRSGTAPTSWSAAPQGMRWAPGEGRGGSQALAATAPDASGWRGASQTLVLDRASAAPLTVGGWSRAEEVSGGRDNGYALYVDLRYTDGTSLWGRTAHFGTGTHDWERREVRIVPEKPVQSLTVHCLLRGHSGRVWFDDVTVTEVAATGEAFVFQGTPMEMGRSAPPARGERREVATGDGLRLGLHGDRVVSVNIDGRELAGAAPGGFLARDVAANSDVFAFADGVCPELGLRLEVSMRTNAAAVIVEGQVGDTRGVDRALLLVFALPVGGPGWMWDDDIRRSRPLAGRGEFVNANDVGCGTTGTMSAYPVGAIRDERTGLSLGLDQGQPAQYRLGYHAATRQLFLAFDFGLVPETSKFPGAAPFRFVIFRFDPAWGFREAWRKYTAMFPEHYVVRSREQGIWMPFTDVATVEGWEDFGFRYHEGNNAVGWDDAHGILSFRYTEPMTWWMSMDPALPRTTEEALRVRDSLAVGGPDRTRRMAAVSRSSAMAEADGSPALLFRNEPWANGAVWSLNPNPYLPDSPNAATVHWNDAYRDATYGSAATNRLDGEYLDSLEGYVTADLNFRREHFGRTTVPLSFATDTGRPALFKGLAVWEFTRWMSEDVHRLGRLMFANGVPYRFGFLCPWLDVLGTETDWVPGGSYRPPSQAQLDLWRTLSGGKPYLLLMNTDYGRFTPDLVERYFQRSLFQGFLPSMFSHNASENPYWRNPAWYNRDRALFRKYMPLIRQVAEAGWQPVTQAAFDPPRVLVERFGPGPDGVTYLTLRNDSAHPQEGLLTLVGPSAPNLSGGAATELVSGERLPRRQGGWAVGLAAEATAVVRLAPGP